MWHNRGGQRLLLMLRGMEGWPGIAGPGRDCRVPGCFAQGRGLHGSFSQLKQDMTVVDAAIHLGQP